MLNLHKRIEGLLIAALGVALYTYIIPHHTETVEYGWLKPHTVPNVVAVVLMLCGVDLALRPPKQEQEDPVQMARALMYLGVVSAGVLAIAWVGFLDVAPVLALVLMLLIGERRPLWLLAGVAGVPAFIWFCVEILLQRPLPG